MTDTNELARRPSAHTRRAIEIIQAQSAGAQFECAPAAEARRLGLRVERFGAATLVLMRRSQALEKNRVMALGQASPATKQQLDRVVGTAREHGVGAVGAVIGDGARPVKLESWLESRGFVERRPVAKLWRDGAPLNRRAAPRDVSVRRVSPTQVGLWVDVVAEVWPTFGFRRAWFEARATAPGWLHYIARIDGEPAGAASMYVDDAGRFRAGHLFEAATMRAWRRRGVQKALIRRRLSDGRRLGCELFTSETAPPLPRMPQVSFRNLCRQGFDLAYLQRPWKLSLQDD